MVNITTDHHLGNSVHGEEGHHDLEKKVPASAVGNEIYTHHTQELTVKWNYLIVDDASPSKSYAASLTNVYDNDDAGDDSDATSPNGVQLTSGFTSSSNVTMNPLNQNGQDYESLW